MEKICLSSIYLLWSHFWLYFPYAFPLNSSSMRSSWTCTTLDSSTTWRKVCNCRCLSYVGQKDKQTLRKHNYGSALLWVLPCKKYYISSKSHILYVKSYFFNTKEDAYYFLHCKYLILFYYCILQPRYNTSSK